MSKLFVLVLIAAAAVSARDLHFSGARVFTGCQSNFNDDFQEAAGNAHKECAAFQTLTECIQAAFTHADLEKSFEPLQYANEIISQAVSQPTTCNLESVGLSAKEHAKHRTARSTVITLYELADRLAALEASRASYQSDTADQISQVVAMVTAFGTTIASVVDNLFASNVALLNTRLSAVNDAISAGKAAVPNVAAAVADVQSYTNSALATETGARGFAKMGMDSSIASLSTTIANGLAAAIADRTSIRSTAVASNPATSIINAVNSQLTVELTRESSAANTRITAETSTRTAKSTTIATAMSSENSRISASCSTKASSFQYAVPTRDGTLDDTDCNSRGAAYYSAKSGQIYFCNGAFYVPVIMDLGFTGFPATKILSPNQRSQLSNVVGTNQKWLRCYSGQVDGFSSTTFHSNCNAKGLGPQLAIMKENSGRIFGGYTDTPFTSSSYGWRYAQGAWTYRFSADGNQIDVLYPYQYINPYTIYDSNSYGPIFGYGAGSWDMCVYGGMTTGYVGMYGYWTYYSYKLNFSPCTGCGYGALYTNAYPNFTLSDLEVYYRSS